MYYMTFRYLSFNPRYFFHLEVNKTQSRKKNNLFQSPNKLSFRNNTCSDCILLNEYYINYR